MSKSAPSFDQFGYELLPDAALVGERESRKVARRRERQVGRNLSRITACVRREMRDQRRALAAKLGLQIEGAAVLGALAALVWFNVVAATRAAPATDLGAIWFLVNRWWLCTGGFIFLQVFDLMRWPWSK